MGTILSRKRKDGTVGHTAVIRIKKGGKVVHTESETFDRKQAAEAWMKKRETALAEPGGLDKREDPTLKAVIEQYNLEKLREHGRTKAQVLKTISESDLGARRCSEIAARDIVAYIQALTMKDGRPPEPSTRQNYLSHLTSVFKVARPAWGYPLDWQAATDARIVLNKLGIIGRSKERERRPTLEELDRLMNFYSRTVRRRRDTIPMQKIICFAIFSTRRQEEITTVLREDLDAEHHELLVRDMKDPGETVGNLVRTTLTPEALQLIERHGAKKGEIWPYNHRTISHSFRKACNFLGIEDLHFHDLRHDGISRLFEMGWTIPQAATVSGHRTWESLKRYSHIKQRGDKYADWPWLKKVLALEPGERSA
ncbi:tyrosine-type recombinase/integrase [Roseateles sp.]|uniref:tyrosine-type recombinase/integrase n=1 Tax=Roseateles sp. TaxID=1971397 RepID=UPI002F402ABA